jgi:hypothetical protein
MVRNLILSFALFLAATGSGFAQFWKFSFGPDFGAAPKHSYAEVSAGSHLMRVHGQGDRGALAMTATFGSFETGNTVPRSLENGAPITLHVVGDSGKYKRSITSSQYAWEYRSAEYKTLASFWLTPDDISAMANSHVILLEIDKQHFNFSSSGAASALNSLVQTLIEAQG